MGTGAVGFFVMVDRLRFIVVSGVLVRRVSAGNLVRLFRGKCPLETVSLQRRKDFCLRTNEDLSSAERVVSIILP